MAPQDSFIDDEEDTCPLCIEELDIQDKNFYPCPCGYQVCQFCYNNIKHNLNGLCPACRRQYDDSSVKFEAVTQEQIAEFRANIQKNQKKRAAEQRQKEVQKREITDRTSRKNLVGVRVVQKNLVYVTGLTPTVPEDELLKTLRKQEFFGQYGNIQKISISNRKAPDGQPQSLGIYVTFEKKEDAARCIAAVNGSHNGDRILRAQLGTTKYCSAWLRNEQCGNRQCMFLHELGEEEDSYTRQDLSSLNSIHTQRPLSNVPGSSRSASRQQGGAPQVPPPIAQPMVRTSSKEGSEMGDGPILPASANWARTTQQRSRRGSHATSGAASSPAISSSLPVTAESAQEAVESSPPPEEPPAASAPSSRKTEKQPASLSAPQEIANVQPRVRDPYALPDFGDVMKRFMALPDFTPPKEHDDSFPPLFDPYGGYKRRVMREEEEKENPAAEQEEQPDKLSEGEPESGSHALGGEPEDRDQEGFDQRRNPAPIQRTATDALFGPSLTSSFAQGAGNIGSVGSRSMTPQQFGRPQSGFADQVPPGLSAPQSSLFQGQGQGQAQGQGQGHSRQQSRFSFANENASGSTKVNLAANPRLMAQQTSMMPSSFQSQPGNQFYGSSMPGPPPGLKSTGTPPGVGGMFGQGQGFGAGFGAPSKDNANELLRSMFSRGTSNAQETGKHDELLPLDEHSVDALVADSDPLDFVGSVISGQSGTTTPAPPPGLGFPRPHMPIHAPIQFGEASSVVSTPAALSPAIARPQPAIPRPVTPLTPVKAKLGSKKAVKAETAAPTSEEAKKSIKDLAVESGLSKDIALQQSKSLKEEDFPALDSVKNSSPPKTATVLPVKPPASAKPEKGRKKAEQKAESEILSKAASSKPAAISAQAKVDKRPTPGILDIAAATTKLASRAMELEASVDKSSSSAPANPPAKSVVSSAHPTPTLTTASIASPLTRAAPKTLRLIQTPKTEQPPSLPSATVASIRSAAVAAAGHRPGTPASEAISDSTSVVSASVSASRTSSPPPSRVGTAAIRSTTKSQQRKQRTKASKDAAAAIAETKTAEEEVEVAPIEGRKKKQKKEKKPKASTSASPAVSRPESPMPDVLKDGPARVEVSATKARSNDEKVARKDRPSTVLPEPTKTPAPAKEIEAKVNKEPLASPAPIDTSIRLNESTKTTVLTPDYAQPSAESRQQEAVFDGAVGEIPTLSEILQSLIEEGELPDPDEMNLLKSVPNYRADVERSAAAALPPTVRSVVTKEDEAELNAFRAVRKEINGHRVLLTPNGDFVLNLGEDEERRYLDLQASIAKMSGEAISFTAPKHAIPGSGFSLIKGRAVPNGMPSFFPVGPGSFPPDPVGKMHREEAIGCINQHVLPSLNLGSYKTNSAFPNNANSVNLQSLAPWISGATNFMDKEGKKSKMYGDTNWDDMDDFPHHDGDGVTGGPSPAIGSTPLMSVEEAESVLAQAKKQHDATDKKFRSQMLKLRRTLGLH